MTETTSARSSTTTPPRRRPRRGPSHIEERLLGRSELLARTRKLASLAAAVDVPTLVTGETGTGKSLVARLIHEDSGRRAGPFVPVNCSGVPDGLFESEFFGHRRGAFTGAVEQRRGLFELAHRGTLFLDEVAELPTHQQAKLLTALEGGAIRRVGDDRLRTVDVRIVAATSRDLSKAVPEGVFRTELYHRLGVLTIAMPPLRYRPGDLPVLSRRILDGIARKYGEHLEPLGPDAVTVLAAHSWPGNVRELAHVLEAAFIRSAGAGPTATALREAIDAQPVLAAGRPAGGAPVSTAPGRASPRPPAAAGGPGTACGPGVPPDAGSPTRFATARKGRGGTRYSHYGSADSEREAIRLALERCRGNKTRAAAELGMARNTLRRKVQRYGL